jgi:hypothetical protein
MSTYGSPDPEQRQNDAAAARRAMLEKFRAASADPKLAEKLAERAVINQARLDRQAAREAEQQRLDAIRAAEAAREAERLAEAKREEERLQAMLTADEAERAIQLAAEQKAARDARYAARKAVKKKRRRGL